MALVHRRGLHRSYSLLSVFIFSCLLLHDPIHAAPTDGPIKSRDRFFAVCFLDGQRGFIVGDKGLILTTDNGGKQWNRQEQSTFRPFYDITFADDNGWIVGTMGTILYSIDKGHTWEAQSSGSQAALMSVHAINKERVLAVGEGGAILETDDRGDTWRQNDFDLFSALPPELIERGIIAPNLYDICFTESGHGWIVGDNGIILHSTDQGRNWQVVRIGLLPSLFSIYFRDTQTGWAVGQNGVVLFTGDGGENWTKQSLDSDANVYTVFVGESRGIIVGENGTVFESFDAGKHWQPKPLSLPPPAPSFLDIAVFPSKSSGVAVIAIGENTIKTFTLEGKGTN